MQFIVNENGDVEEQWNLNYARITRVVIKRPETTKPVFFIYFIYHKKIKWQPNATVFIYLSMLMKFNGTDCVVLYIYSIQYTVMKSTKLKIYIHKMTKFDENLSQVDIPKFIQDSSTCNLPTLLYFTHRNSINHEWSAKD